MPSTYLLLRNNKQTGPHSLESLLQQGLKPHDLIWVEGQSAGWSYPAEINQLKAYFSNTTQPVSNNPTPGPATTSRNETGERRSASHIYVALPAGPRQVETTITTSFEEKADALYQRVQAFSEGRTTDETETRYARSLDDMKQEYGTWLVNQKRKKTGYQRRKIWIAAALLIITTSGFTFSKWITHRAPLQQQLATEPVITFEKKEPVAAVYKSTIPTDTTATVTTVPVTDVATKATAKTNNHAALKKAAAKPALQPTPVVDSIQNSTPTPVSPVPAPVVKHSLPLSQLVAVRANLQSEDRNEKGAEVILKNNSSEVLRSVSVVVSYFKKEDRALGKETIIYYNVQPGNSAVINTTGNKRATSVQVALGSITRSDGSLYLVN